MKTPVGKGAALLGMSLQKGPALNVTVDVEVKWHHRITFLILTVIQFVAVRQL